jgi:hypothetical protein
MLERIADALQPWGVITLVLIVVGLVVLWSLWLQELLPAPWGLRERRADTRCPDCGEPEAQATFCSLGGCPMRAACEHSSCELVGRDRLKCDYLVCHDRELAERAFGVAPPAQVISIEGCAAVSGWRRHRPRI